MTSRLMSWYCNGLVPFYDGPNLKYQIGFGYDITQLKKVEREIIQLNEQLEGKWWSVPAA